MSDRSDPYAIDALARLSFVTAARMEERASEQGISVQQTRLLGILRDREPTMQELTEHIGPDKSSVSGLVQRAERRGLVRRVPDVLDRRSVRVRLEPAGRAVIDAASDSFADDVRLMLSSLSAAERASWVDMTTRMLTAETEARGVGFS